MPRGRACQAQGCEPSVTTGRSQSRGGTGKRHERHNQQQAGKERQHDVCRGVLIQAVGIGDTLLPDFRCSGFASVEIDCASNGVVGGGTPHEPMHAAQNGEKDSGGCGKSNDGQHRSMTRTATRAGAMEQSPQCESAHRTPPSWPSCMVTVREQNEATLGSWVTTTTAEPLSRAAAIRMPITSRPVA